MPGQSLFPATGTSSAESNNNNHTIGNLAGHNFLGQPQTAAASYSTPAKSASSSYTSSKISTPSSPIENVNPISGPSLLGIASGDTVSQPQIQAKPSVQSTPSSSGYSFGGATYTSNPFAGLKIGSSTKPISVTAGNVPVNSTTATSTTGNIQYTSPSGETYYYHSPTVAAALKGTNNFNYGANAASNSIELNKAIASLSSPASTSQAQGPGPGPMLLYSQFGQNAQISSSGGQSPTYVISGMLPNGQNYSVITTVPYLQNPEFRDQAVDQAYGTFVSNPNLKSVQTNSNAALNINLNQANPTATLAGAGGYYPATLAGAATPNTSATATATLPGMYKSVSISQNSKGDYTNFVVNGETLGNNYTYDSGIYNYDAQLSNTGQIQITKALNPEAVIPAGASFTIPSSDGNTITISNNQNTSEPLSSLTATEVVSLSPYSETPSNNGLIFENSGGKSSKTTIPVNLFGTGNTASTTGKETTIIDISSGNPVIVYQTPQTNPQTIQQTIQQGLTTLGGYGTQAEKYIASNPYLLASAALGPLAPAALGAAGISQITNPSSALTSAQSGVQATPSYINKTLPQTLSNTINSLPSAVYNNTLGLPDYLKQIGYNSLLGIGKSEHAIGSAIPGILGIPNPNPTNPNILNQPIGFGPNPSQTYGQYLSSTPQGRYLLQSSTKPYDITQTGVSQQLYGLPSLLGPHALTYGTVKGGELAGALVAPELLAEALPEGAAAAYGARALSTFGKFLPYNVGFNELFNNVLPGNYSPKAEAQTLVGSAEDTAAMAAFLPAAEPLVASSLAKLGFTASPQLIADAAKARVSPTEMLLRNPESYGVSPYSLAQQLAASGLPAGRVLADILVNNVPKAMESGLQFGGFLGAQPIGQSLPQGQLPSSSQIENNFAAGFLPGYALGDLYPFLEAANPYARTAGTMALNSAGATSAANLMSLLNQGTLAPLSTDIQAALLGAALAPGVEAAKSAGNIGENIGGHVYNRFFNPDIQDFFNRRVSASPDQLATFIKDNPQYAKLVPNPRGLSVSKLVDDINTNPDNYKNVLFSFSDITPQNDNYLKNIKSLTPSERQNLAMSNPNYFRNIYNELSPTQESNLRSNQFFGSHPEGQDTRQMLFKTYSQPNEEGGIIRPVKNVISEIVKAAKTPGAEATHITTPKGVEEQISKSGGYGVEQVGGSKGFRAVFPSTQYYGPSLVMMDESGNPIIVQRGYTPYAFGSENPESESNVAPRNMNPLKYVGIRTSGDVVTIDNYAKLSKSTSELNYLRKNIGSIYSQARAYQGMQFAADSARTAGNIDSATSLDAQAKEYLQAHTNLQKIIDYYTQYNDYGANQGKFILSPQTAFLQSSETEVNAPQGVYQEAVSNKPTEIQRTLVPNTGFFRGTALENIVPNIIKGDFYSTELRPTLGLENEKGLVTNPITGKSILSPTSSISQTSEATTTPSIQAPSAYTTPSGIYDPLTALEQQALYNSALTSPSYATNIASSLQGNAQAAAYQQYLNNLYTNQYLRAGGSVPSALSAVPPESALALSPTLSGFYGSNYAKQYEYGVGPSSNFYKSYLKSLASSPYAASSLTSRMPPSYAAVSSSPNYYQAYQQYLSSLSPSSLYELAYPYSSSTSSIPYGAYSSSPSSSAIDQYSYYPNNYQRKIGSSSIIPPLAAYPYMFTAQAQPYRTPKYSPFQNYSPSLVTLVNPDLESQIAAAYNPMMSGILPRPLPRTKLMA